jgi:phosphopantetheine--protein transferase-like protein
VVELSGICDAGIRGVVEERGAPGCMLDNAGQIFGLWIQQKSERDKMAMPVTMTAARFYGPDAKKGERYDVKVAITKAGPQTVKADLEVSRDGRVWCSIEGWEDRRFESDAEAWPVMLYPDRNALARAHPRIPGAFTLVPRLERVATRDYFARRFLSSPEIETYRTLNPRRQIEWLAGRIAAKDAVRSVVWERGAEAVFPIEIEIVDEPSGRPTVVTKRASDLAVSIAHKRGIAVALLGRDGRAPGIDVERVEPRDAAFERTAFADEERALLDAVSAGDPRGSELRQEWIARFWAAKEALSKARGTGLFTGLGGAPTRYPIERVDGERIVVDGRSVDTLREGEWVLAWTFEEGRRR